MSNTNNTNNTHAEVPAGRLRLDGNTYPHRAGLKKNGWVWSGRGSAWTKTTGGGKIAIRSGCRLVCDSTNTVIYDTAEGAYRAPSSFPAIHAV